MQVSHKCFNKPIDESGFGTEHIKLDKLRLPNNTA